MENLVKTWEMEVTHKTDLSQWTTISQERIDEYSVQANGGKVVEGKEIMERGNYNVLMQESCVYQKCML